MFVERIHIDNSLSILWLANVGSTPDGASISRGASPVSVKRVAIPARVSK